jgi:hypothetical protein
VHRVYVNVTVVVVVVSGRHMYTGGNGMRCGMCAMYHPWPAMQVLSRGLETRHVGATSMNRDSSRSHAVFTVVLQSKVRRSAAHTVHGGGV